MSDGKQSHDLAVDPLLVDFKVAAGMIGVGVSTFYNMNRSGELGPQVLRLRGRRLWSRPELEAWVKARCPRREIWAAMSRSPERKDLKGRVNREHTVGIGHNEEMKPGRPSVVPGYLEDR
jgi:hypothetical protein